MNRQEFRTRGSSQLDGARTRGPLCAGPIRDRSKRTGFWHAVQFSRSEPPRCGLGVPPTCSPRGLGVGFLRGHRLRLAVRPGLELNSEKATAQYGPRFPGGPNRDCIPAGVAVSNAPVWSRCRPRDRPGEGRRSRRRMGKVRANHMHVNSTRPAHDFGRPARGQAPGALTRGRIDSCACAGIGAHNVEPLPQHASAFRRA